MSEDLGAEQLVVINCGMARGDHVPMDQMGPWVQDALDAIEYANGPVDSKRGALRAKAGHPKPFNLKYIEIGNENGGRRIPGKIETGRWYDIKIECKGPSISCYLDGRLVEKMSTKDAAEIRASDKSVCIENRVSVVISTEVRSPDSPCPGDF
jgi:alpha-L-arabinofuranosidase